MARRRHKINLIKISDPKLLGEWAGLCKLDKEGVARKVVGCSCGTFTAFRVARDSSSPAFPSPVVVKDFGQESEALNVLLEYFVRLLFRLDSKRSLTSRISTGPALSVPTRQPSTLPKLPSTPPTVDPLVYPTLLYANAVYLFTETEPRFRGVRMAGRL